MNEPDEPWLKAHLELMEHILTLQRDMSILRAKVEVLESAQPDHSAQLVQLAQTISAFLQTKSGQALIASVLAGLAALGKWLVDGH